MKRYLPIGLVLALLGSASFVAAEGKHKGMNPDQKIEHLSKKLNLTPQQRAQVDPIVRQYYTDLGNTKSSTERKRLEDTMHADINALLTPSQQAMWAAKKAEKDKKKVEPAPAPAPAPEPTSPPPPTRDGSSPY